MTNTEDQKLLATLIDKAEANDHTKFTYICHWTDYRSNRVARRALKLLINSLDAGAASLFNKHCEAVLEGSFGVTNLLIRNTLLKTASFYKAELAIIEDMLSEYEAYLFHDISNFFKQFIFYETRRYAECYDYRRK